VPSGICTDGRTPSPLAEALLAELPSGIRHLRESTFDWFAGRGPSGRGKHLKARISPADFRLTLAHGTAGLWNDKTASSFPKTWLKPFQTTQDGW